jgi:hypothetical protein
VIERMATGLDRERERVDQLVSQLTRLSDRLAPLTPAAVQPEPSRLRRAWRWMRVTG